jgi:tetratricopeptide (TPR) repeat protein/uncharacterized membrane protein YhaH (DUF805 family)
MPTLVKTYFSFRGRIGRATWWIGSAVLLAVAFIARWLLSLLGPLEAPILFADAGTAILLAAALALSIKRFNDRNHPSWIGWTWAGLCLIWIVAPRLGLSPPSHPADLPGPTLYLLLSVPASWVLIDNAFLRGTPGPNRYGPDPLAAATPARASAPPGSVAAGRSDGDYIRDGITVSLLAGAGLVWTIGNPAVILRAMDLPGPQRELTLIKDRRANAPAAQVQKDGEEAAKAEDHDAAIRHFTRAIELYGPENIASAQSYRSRARVWRRMDLLQNALADYSKAIAVEPAGSWNYHLRGQVLAGLGRYDEALRDYDTATVGGASADTDISRGWVLEKLDRPAEALTVYGRAIETAVKRADESAARLAARGGEWLGWQENLQALHSDQITRAHIARANLYLGLNRLDEALADYHEAVRVRPDYARAYSLRGWLYEKQGRRELAHADYEKAAALRTPDAWLASALKRTQ